MTANIHGVGATPTITNIGKDAVQPTHNTQTDGYVARHNAHMYGADNMHKASTFGNIDMANLLNQIRRNRRLEQRTLSTIDTGQSAYAMPPEVLDDVHKRMLGLVSGGHLKNMSSSLLQRLKRNKKQNIIDDNNHLKKDDDDEISNDVIKVKKAEGVSLDENGVQDAITNMLGNKNTPTQRYMLISMTLQQPDVDPELKGILENILNKEFAAHGTEIRAKINTVDDASIFGNGNEKKITLFQDAYYELLKAQDFKQMLSICFMCVDEKEFGKLTNLMDSAAHGDLNKKRLSPSDPNTIHDLISFMHLRTSFISMFDAVKRFKKANQSPLKDKKDKKKNFGSDLITQPNPKNII